MTRASMLEVLDQPLIRAARLKDGTIAVTEIGCEILTPHRRELVVA